MKKTIIVAVAGFVIVAAGLFIVLRQNSGTSPTNTPAANLPTITQTDTSLPPSEIDQAAVTANADDQANLLRYLIEEEKLAHDVYVVLHDMYGATVFGNILNSEQTHQDRVLALLQPRNIADPRSLEPGVFVNPELQTLHDTLIAQGKQGVASAYAVGVAIEEKDIADITKQLATATDADVVAALEALRSGSENHLRAFNRQLGKY